MERDETDLVKETLPGDDESLLRAQGVEQFGECGLDRARAVVYPLEGVSVAVESRQVGRHRGAC